MTTSKLGPMTSKKMFYGMIAGTALAFIALTTAVVLGDIWLHKRSDQLRSVKLDSRLLDEQQVALVQANKDISKYADLETIANAIVPQDKDQAKTVREIVKIAQDANIPITNISFPTSNLGSTTTSSTSGGTSTSGSDSSSSSKKSSTSEESTATAAPKAPPVTQVKPADGIKGVYQLEINVQSDSSAPVPYSSLLTFLERLEQNRRTAQVSNITVTPSTKDPGLVTFTLIVNVFIKP